MGILGPPPDESLATIDNYALAVMAILTSLQINYVDFIGYHTGLWCVVLIITTLIKCQK